MRILKILMLTYAAISLSGCISLQKRPDTATYKKEPPLVRDLRIENANLKSQVQDYQAQIREYAGKVEELEIRLRRANEGTAKRLGQESAELSAYKESLAALAKEKKLLQDKIIKLQLENKDTNKKLSQAQKSLSDHMDAGDGFFDDRKWTEAVAEYQAYREKAKKVKQENTEDYALATYKIGVCFQELKMKQEAKTFYQSVLKKNKETKAAKYAKYRLENLK